MHCSNQTQHSSTTVQYVFKGDILLFYSFSFKRPVSKPSDTTEPLFFPCRLLYVKGIYFGFISRTFSRFDISMWPGIFSTSYASQVSKFGNMVEVRVGRRTQHLSVFTRMLDKDSSWGYDNGLKSMVTTLLQFGITGEHMNFYEPCLFSSGCHFLDTIYHF